MSQKHPPTACCKYEAPLTLQYPVMWNPYNGIVQCHNCGQQFEPPKSREEIVSFGDWAMSYSRKVNQSIDFSFTNGKYQNRYTEGLWQCWQESRKRMVPNPMYTNAQNLAAAPETAPAGMMAKNTPGDICPSCGAVEVAASLPETMYSCGSYDYDQRPGTFKQSENCKIWSSKRQP